LPSKVNQSNKIHEELSVVVSNPQEGLVTVKVADSQGNEIRVLYAGILPAGEHNFTWDGKGESGQVASPGVYDLVVTSGTKVLHQKVRLGATR
jgi:flagellar hook assembly protein FlgD